MRHYLSYLHTLLALTKIEMSYLDFYYQKQQTNCGDKHITLHFNLTFCMIQHTSSEVMVKQIFKKIIYW